MNEEKVAGSNYIINFFNNIQYLNHSYANYINALLELEIKYGDNPKKEGMDVNDLNNVIKIGQELRYHCHKIYIEYNSIFAVLKQQIDEEINSTYKDFIKKDLLVGRDKAELFIIKINQVLINHVIKDLLTSSQDVFNSIYGSEKRETGK